MDVLPAPLAPLAAREQFVTWYALPHPDKPGKFDKIPCLWSSGANCDAHNPANWTSAARALAMAPAYDRGYGSGAGFVFTSDDPFYFLDIDGCLLPDGQWSPVAADLCARLAGAAIEISHSGRGLHIFGQTAPLIHGTRNTPLHLELYTSGRFVALTGTGAMGDAATDCTAALAHIASTLFAPTAGVAPRGAWTAEPVPEWSGPEDDGELIRRELAAASRNAAAAFGGAQTFADLWNGNVSDTARSEADQSLANHLAFWTGKNCERIERLMRASGLLRDKWDSPSHRDYLERTILNACAFVTSVASTPARPEPVDTVTPAAPGRLPMYVPPDLQVGHFADCTYVLSEAKVWSTKHSGLLTQAAFDVAYGGYNWIMDPMGETKSKSAYEAFTQSKVHACRIADDMCFRPELPTGQVIEEEGRRLVNTYVRYDCPEKDGDASPLVGHIRRMLPHDGDAEILLNYMAFLKQYPGIKAQWWPVVQGVQGNAKTLLIDVLRYCAGNRYSHLPSASAMARDGLKFNGWVRRKLFIGLDEVALSHKREFLEEFKVIITSRILGVEPKGGEQILFENRANGIICTNHRDGVPVDDRERRYAILYTAQQDESDLDKCGMTSAYFTALYDWFNADGAAIMARYLTTYPVDKSVMMGRAPATSSKQAAIVASRGRAEQEVQEAIDEGRVGFMGGWVSSKHLDDLLDGRRLNVPRSKRPELLRTLGYIPHPGLGDDGRVNNPVAPDGARSRLYVRVGHLSINIGKPADVAAAYTKAQTVDRAVNVR